MLPATAQDRQVPVQLELQQIPCWQSPDAHSPPPVQAVPGAFFAQPPAMQTLGATQSASAEQVVRQAPLAPQLNGSQATAAVVWQVPEPLHVRAGRWLAWAQLSATQIVPLAWRRQPPTPSQAPSVPQLTVPWTGH
jgi:hypothetical protein